VRADAEDRIRPDPARLAAGWERRFVIELPRAPDLVQLYEQAGFEVAIDHVEFAQVDDECSDCRLLLFAGFVSVYTRRRAAEQGGK
jgi:hypothetical protein